LDSYKVSKLIELLFVRELVSCLDTAKSPGPPVIINLVSPGLSSSNLGRNRNPSLAFKILRFFLQLTIMHTAEEGSRGLVLSACAGTDSHGEFMYNGENRELEKWIYTDMGKRAQRKVFEQTMKVLEARKPGIGKSVGL
jgi:retinol dehydrogenase-12